MALRKLHTAVGGFVGNRDHTIDRLIASPKSPFSEGDRPALQIARSALLARLADEFLVGNKMRTREAVWATKEDELPDAEDEVDEEQVKTNSKLRNFLGLVRSRNPVVHADDEEVEAMMVGTLGTNPRFGAQGLENARGLLEAQRRFDEYASRPREVVDSSPVSQDELDAMMTPSTTSVLKARRAK